MNRWLAGVALLFLAAGTAGCGGSSSATKLTIEVSHGDAVLAYTLRCDPASGTVPDPRGICDQLRREPKLLVGGRAFDHPCPGGDFKAFRVSGTYRGYDVDAIFPPESCAWVPGQDGAPAEWDYLMHDAEAGRPEPQLGGSTAVDAATQKRGREVTRTVRRLQRERSEAVRSGALPVRWGARPDPRALAFFRAEMRGENLTGPEIFEERVFTMSRRRLEHRLGFRTFLPNGPVYFVVVRYAFRDYMGRRHASDDLAWAIIDGRTLKSTDAGGGGRVSTAGLTAPVVLRP